MEAGGKQRLPQDRRGTQLRDGVSIGAIAAVLLGAGAAQAQTAADTPAVAGGSVVEELVVTARKLRKVRVDYRLRGRHLRYCAARNASEDPESVRLMCNILVGCVRKGYRRQRQATRCVNATLDLLDEGPLVQREPQGR